MGRIFRSHWPLFILAFVEIILFTTNYTSGTYFLGWDNLFPEMNFLENFRRSFFGVWQEYRGLGLLDGMSFAANLPHYAFLFLLSFFLPEDLLRYFFIFLMHFLGGVGVYFLILELMGNHLKTKWPALFGALFYLFNIGTVQIFFVPYEVFTVHFAFLPILILFLIKYLKSGSKKHLFYFMIFSFLSAPQAHVPTLFIVFIVALFSILFFHLLYTRKKGLVKVAIITIITFSVHSFWGLPYIYSALNNAQIISSSKINQMATDDIYFKNKAYGDIVSVILMKGFSLDFVGSQSSDYMMKAWRTHTQQPAFVVIGFILFAVVLIGFLHSIINKEKRFYPFICLFLLTFFMLADDVPIIGGVSFFLRTYIPFFDQIFRFTFTKFFILYAFASSILFSLGLFYLINQVSKINNLNRLLIAIFFLTLTYYSFPIWQGHFLYRAQGLKIPEEYFMLVNFFKNQDKDSRVALIPQTSLWGWTYNAWGYQGSGFIWYGIPQATLDGAFYPWSKENENYYWELTQAFFKKDKILFEAVLDKYQIGWIVVDDSLKSPLVSDISYNGQIQEVIGKSDKLKLEKNFGGIWVYRVNLSHNLANFIFIGKNLPVVGSSYQWGEADQGYLDNGDYISMQQGGQPADLFYPFRSLFTARQQEELEFQVKDEGGYFSFKSNIPKEMVGSKLIIPLLSQDEIADEYPNIFLDNELIQFDVLSVLPTEVSLPYIKEGVLEIRVPKTKGYQDLDPTVLDLEPKICNQFNKGINKYDKVVEDGKTFLKIISIGSDNCLTLPVPNLAQKIGYLITIESGHIEGKSLLFAVINETSRRADLEVSLPKNKVPAVSYFVIPPMEYGGLGYTLYFDNISYGRARTINNLGRITVNPIPYQFLKSLRVVRGRLDSQHDKNISISIKTDHPNPSLYKVIVEGDQRAGFGNAAMLVLSQSFDKGWKAYKVKAKCVLSSIFPFFCGKEQKNHVIVNNWENGWVLDNSQFVIIYLPQYLEYLGFGLLSIVFTWVTIVCLRK